MSVWAYLWRWLVRRSSSALFFSGSLCTRAWMALTLYFWSSYSDNGKDRRRMRQDSSNSQTISRHFHVKLKKQTNKKQSDKLTFSWKYEDLLTVDRSFNSCEACRDKSNQMLRPGPGGGPDAMETYDVWSGDIPLLGYSLEGGVQGSHLLLWWTLYAVCRSVQVLPDICKNHVKSSVRRGFTENSNTVLYVT